MVAPFALAHLYFQCTFIQPSGGQHVPVMRLIVPVAGLSQDPCPAADA